MEHNESQELVDRLLEVFRTSGLATLGVAATKAAIRSGLSDQLLVSSSLGQGDRERLVRAASQAGVPIETVRHSCLLDEQGGAGALLRYQPGLDR